MASRLIAAHLDLNQNQLLNAVVQVITADPGGSVGGQFWYRSDLSNGVGNGVLSYKDSSGNVIRVAVGGVALSNAYATITDGTTPASASGADTVKFRAAGGGFTVATGSNDATHGDNVLYTLNSSTTGGANTIPQASSTNRLHAGDNLLLNSLTPIATAGAISYFGGYFSGGDGSSSDNFLQLTKSASGITNKTFVTIGLNGTAPSTVAGNFGFTSTGNDLQFGDGTVVQTIVTLTKTQTLTNKTLTTPTVASFVNATHDHQSAAGGSVLTHLAISDFDTQVRTSRLDQMTAPTAAVSFNSQRITGLSDPTSAQDAATKAYVDATATGLDVKASVRAASTANVSATYNATGGASGRGQYTAAPNTLDGVTLAAGNRILLKDQTTPAQNGIFVISTLGTGANGVWDRATDFDQDAEVTAGAFTFVEEGTANTDRGYVLTTNNPITIGGASGTSLAFAPFSGAGSIIDGNGLVFTGNTLDVVGTAGRIVANANSIDLVSGIIATPGTYTSLTIDTYGRATAGADIITANGIVVRTAAGTFTNRSVVTASAARITVTNGDGVAGNPTLDLATTVTAGTGIINTFDVYGRITSGADLIGAGGIPARTAANTYAARTMTGTAGNITVTNGDGVAGNPTFNLPNVGTAGTYDSVTTDAQGRVTAGTSKSFAGNIGDGSSTTITVTHSLGTQDVVVAVYSATTPWAEVYPEVRHSTTNTVQLLFNVAPTLNQYRVVIKSV